MTRFLAAAWLVLLPFAALAQDAETTPDSTKPDVAEAPMTLETLGQIIAALDPAARTNGIAWQLTIAEIEILVVTDADADRMRAMAPIRESEGLSQEEMLRMMQANFDSALDARYAIAQGTLWATFIHPLSPLEKDEFISGLGQTVNLAKTYGSLYSGGGLQYGGGDSGAIQRELIDELLKKGEEI